MPARPPLRSTGWPVAAGLVQRRSHTSTLAAIGWTYLGWSRPTSGCPRGQGQAAADRIATFRGPRRSDGSVLRSALARSGLILSVSGQPEYMQVANSDAIRITFVARMGVQDPSRIAEFAQSD
jgi:hypothetical protein